MTTLFDAIPGMEASTSISTQRKKRNSNNKKASKKINPEKVEAIEFEAVEKEAPQEDQPTKQNETLELEKVYADIFHELILQEKLKKANVREGNRVKIWADKENFKLVRERFALFGGEYVAGKGKAYFQFQFDPRILLSILSSGASVLKLIEENESEGNFPPHLFYLKEIFDNLPAQKEDENPTTENQAIENPTTDNQANEAETEEIYYPHLDKAPTKETPKPTTEVEKSTTFTAEEQRAAFAYFRTHLKAHFGKVNLLMKQDFDIEFYSSGTFWNDELTAFNITKYLERVKGFEAWEAYQKSEVLKEERC